MPYCSSCGTEHGLDAQFCPSCGASLESPPESQVSSSAEESATADDGQMENTDSKPSGYASQQTQDVPSADAGIADTVRRRPVLALLVAGVVGASGYFLILDDDGNPDSPDGVVQLNWNAWMDGDADTYAETMHPEGPAWEDVDDDWRDDFGFEPQEGEEIDLEAITIESEEDEEAVVDLEYYYRYSYEDREEYDIEYDDNGWDWIKERHELLRDDEDWRIWSWEIEESEWNVEREG